MEYLNNFILNTKDNNILNPFKYLSFLAVINHFIYKYNIYYCYNRPFTTYFNKFSMDNTSTKNFKMIRISLLIIPIYSYYLHKANQQKLTDISENQTAIYYSKEISKDILLPLSLCFISSYFTIPLFTKSKSYSSSKYLYMCSILLVYSIGLSLCPYISNVKSHSLSIVPVDSIKNSSNTRVLA